jgi:hypothetical protein
MPVGLRPQDSSKQSVRRPKIVVGKDTRLSGYMMEQALRFWNLLDGRGTSFDWPTSDTRSSFCDPEHGVTDCGCDDLQLLIIRLKIMGLRFFLPMDISYPMKLKTKLRGWFFQKT